MTTETTTRNWATHKIKDFGVVSTGTTPSTKNKDYYGGNYKLISPADLTDSRYITTAHKFITEEGLKVARTLPKNSVLIGCIGNVGKIGITVDEISAFNQQINAVVCNKSFDADFVYYLLRYNRPLLESKAAKVTLPILNKNNFENIEFETPQLPEQKSIARVLTTIQRAITGQEEWIAKLKELKRSMMQHLFTHGTKGEKTKMTEIGEVPESWEVAAIGDDDISVACYGRAKPKEIGDVPIVGSGGIYGYTKNSLIKQPTIVIARKGSVGGIFYYEKNAWPCDTTFYLEFLGGVIPKFLFYYLSSSLDKLASLYSKTTLPSLSRFDLEMFVFPQPKLIEQKKIVNIIEAADKKIEIAQKKLSTYQDIFKTLLHELMSGDRRVN